MGANIAEKLLYCIELRWVFKNHIINEIGCGEISNVFNIHLYDS
jgi:hypothetical protein